MTDNGRADASQDPLERYRQALRRRSAGLEPEPIIPAPSAPQAPSVTDEPLELDQPLVEEEPLELEEPLAAEEPLELEEPLAAEEPLELDQPLAAEEPLDLGEPLAEEEPLESDGLPEASESPAPDESRTAADWLGLNDELGEEDPLGLDEPLAPEAAPQAATEYSQSDAAADEDVPEELQDTLARYRMAMSKLRSQAAAASPDPLAGPNTPPEGPKPGTDGGDELLSRHQRARRRGQDLGDGASEPGPASRVSREGLGQIGDELDPISEVLDAESEDADELLRDFPTKARVTRRRAHKRNRPASRAALGWSTRAITFAALLFAALPVQWLVYKQLGASFALEDLGAGLSALLPAALILLLARPASGKGRVVMVMGSIVVGLIGSAGFAYGLSLLQNQLPQGTSLVFGLLLSLGLFTAVWGPLFLILVPILSRMSLPARGNP